MSLDNTIDGFEKDSKEELENLSQKARDKAAETWEKTKSKGDEIKDNLEKDI